MNAQITKFVLIALLVMIAFGGSFTCHSTFGDSDPPPQPKHTR